MFLTEKLVDLLRLFLLLLETSWLWFFEFIGTFHAATALPSCSADLQRRSDSPAARPRISAWRIRARFAFISSQFYRCLQFLLENSDLYDLRHCQWCFNCRTVFDNIGPFFIRWFSFLPAQPFSRFIDMENEDFIHLNLFLTRLIAFLLGIIFVSSFLWISIFSLFLSLFRFIAPHDLVDLRTLRRQKRQNYFGLAFVKDFS